MRSALLACLVAIVALTAEGAPKGRGARKPQPQITDAVNNPVWSGATPAAVLRAQILLDRAHFSPGEVDSHPGPNFDRALRAFQIARKIPASGIVDEATWLVLNADTAPSLVPYRITEADVAGPFEPVPEDMMEKAKLKQLGFMSPDEALGEQFHINPALLKRMNPGKKFRAGEEILAPNVVTPLSGKAAKIVVSKQGTLTALDGSGNFLAHYPSTSGSEHDPLPIGTWKITGIHRDPVFYYNPQLFWDADPSHSKAKVAPGPNNPVGVVWIDLSKEHYGIHGTPEPGKVGHTQSHGCIRLTNWDARELSGLLSKGAIAELTE